MQTVTYLFDILPTTFASRARAIPDPIHCIDRFDTCFHVSFHRLLHTVHNSPHKHCLEVCCRFSARSTQIAGPYTVVLAKLDEPRPMVRALMLVLPFVDALDWAFSSPAPLWTRRGRVVERRRPLCPIWAAGAAFPGLWMPQRRAVRRPRPRQPAHGAGAVARATLIFAPWSHRTAWSVSSLSLKYYLLRRACIALKHAR